MREEYKVIKDKFGPDCLFGAPAAGFTTYKAGGAADVLVTPPSRVTLAWLSSFCLDNDIPFLPLGAGSNVLVSDRGFRGVVALTLKLNNIELAGDLLTAEAGALWDDAARVSVEAGLAGLEKTSGIPGTAGGAVFMNAGAFGQETFDCLESFEAMDRVGIVKTFKKAEVRAGYRKVEGLEGFIVLKAAFLLKAGNKEALSADRTCVLAKRAEGQPLDLPSAGSVFKRPPGDYASRLIDAAGLKGSSVGGARVSEKHAGFIVNTGAATASDIYALIRKVQAEVKLHAGIDLELEQVLVGKFD